MASGGRVQAAPDGATEDQSDLEEFDVLPQHIADMPESELQKLLKFANKVQAWSFGDGDGRDVTFGEAAEHFGVPVEQIADAVSAHYWMFTFDVDRPLAARRIEHEGE